MQVAPAIVVAAILLLQLLDQNTQWLSLVGHGIGQQQSIDRAVAFWQEARNSDAARLLAADQHLFALHDKRGHVLEADAVFDQLAAVGARNAVEHARGVESARNSSGPLPALQEPLREH